MGRPGRPSRRGGSGWWRRGWSSGCSQGALDSRISRPGNPGQPWQALLWSRTPSRSLAGHHESLPLEERVAVGVHGAGDEATVGDQRRPLPPAGISVSLPLTGLFGYALAVSDTVGAEAPEAQEFAARLAAGDPEALAWLYDNVASDLYRRLRRRYERPGGPDAADLLQETFLLCLRDGARLLRGAVDGLPAGSPVLPPLRRYLWDLACGLAANARRSVWSRRVVAMPEAPAAAGEPPAERSAIARESLRRLDGCLEQQGERLYLYFKLRYVDRLTPEEIVAGTGWSRKITYKLRQALNE